MVFRIDARALVDGRSVAEFIHSQVLLYWFSSCKNTLHTQGPPTCDILIFLPTCYNVRLSLIMSEFKLATRFFLKKKRRCPLNCQNGSRARLQRRPFLFASYTIGHCVNSKVYRPATYAPKVADLLLDMRHSNIAAIMPTRTRKVHVARHQNSLNPTKFLNSF